jgi:hypothetical protein
MIFSYKKAKFACRTIFRVLTLINKYRNFEEIL